MEVITASSAGFCFGVKRAVDEVYSQIRNGEKPVYTFGPIIHNEQVVKELERLGVQVISSEEELDRIHKGTVIIRSHGVSAALHRRMEASGLKVVDATCPFVKKIHRIAEQAGKDGDVLVIAGDPEHPEVQGIVGWTEGEYHVIRSAEEIALLPSFGDRKVILAAQTTFNASKFEEIVEIFEKTYYHCYVVNTVCNATDERQTEAREIARKVDAMIVVGGRHSSNTQKLFNICKEVCRNTYFIETFADLDGHSGQSLQTFSRVGITAGASTPKSLIEEVQQHVRTKL